MAAPVQIEARFDEQTMRVLRRFRRLPERAQVAMQKSLGRELILTEEAVKSKADIRFRRGARGLAGRLTSFARTTSGGDLDGAIGFRKTRGFPYELSQEFGAKARPGGAMAVPITPMARRAASPRTHPHADKLFAIQGMKKLLLVRETNTAIHVEYVLVKSLPPRLHFRRTIGGRVRRLGDAVWGGWKSAMTEI